MKQKTLAFIIIVIGLSVQGFGLIWVNDIKDVFSPPANTLIDQNLTTGASLFLQSQAAASLLLNEYELNAQGFNIAVANDYAKKAISLLEAAKTEYLKAIDTALEYGVDPKKAAILTAFNFTSIINSVGMNGELAGRVVRHLEKADVIGLYTENVTNIQNILDTLYGLTSQLNQNIQPPLEEFWHLYAKYSEAALFGNYATQFGRRILTR